ncbi:MAG: hypothetical protein ACKOUM_06000, partial [Sphingopyxis sp.]
MTMKFASLMLLPAALGLAGCDGITGNNSADTKLTNVEILPGTASDEMVTLDQANGDGTSLDPSTATGPAMPHADGDDAGEPGRNGADNADDRAKPAGDDAKDDGAASGASAPSPATTGD